MMGPELESAHKRREESGFYAKYMSGSGLDIGFGDYDPAPNCVGIDLKTPGYDGLHLPVDNESQDFVFSSHCLEHIFEWSPAIIEWFRVLKTGGYLIIAVPHQFLYEKKVDLPSNWNGDHKRFYTPAILMDEIEYSLAPNSYRLRYLQDCDENFVYSIPAEQHSGGEYQIECVIQKIEPPKWKLL